MRQWAIVVGLNDYQFFQPLSCAQQDAQALHHFLVQQAGFFPDHCLLMTDNSPALFNRSTLPTRANLQAWVDLFAQQYWQPGDALYVFFSGYGIHYQGKDYLAPLDGSWSAVESTCLSMSDLLNCFRAALPLGDITVLLDMSRSQHGSLVHATVGIQTAQLANQLGIATLLSCQPGQFSREVSSLGHGLFTHGLLEALQYQPGTSLGALVQYLGDRLPELSEYYWQPSQTPVLVCTPTKLHQPLLEAKPPYSGNGSALNGHSPNGALAMQSRSPVQGGAATLVAPVTKVTLQQSGFYSPGTLQNREHANSQPENSQWGHSAIATMQTASPPHASASDSPPPASPYGNGAHDNGAHDNGALDSGVAVPPTAPEPQTELDSFENAFENASWRPVLLWGGVLSLGLIGCVLWRNWSTLWFPKPAIAESKRSSPASASANAPSLREVPVSAGVSGVLTLPPSTTPYPPAGNTPQNEALNFNPIAPSNTPSSTQSGQTILNRARAMVLSNQATPYRDAILEVKQVPASDPAYNEAQQEIITWNQTVWTIAQQRATQKRWDVAIMAADLVSADNVTLHSQAQTAIAQWCVAARASFGDTFASEKAKAICNRQPL
jgi:Caspase domain